LSTNIQQQQRETDKDRMTSYKANLYIIMSESKCEPMTRVMHLWINFLVVLALLLMNVIVVFVAVFVVVVLC